MTIINPQDIPIIDLSSFKSNVDEMNEHFQQTAQSIRGFRQNTEESVESFRNLNNSSLELKSTFLLGSYIAVHLFETFEKTADKVENFAEKILDVTAQISEWIITQAGATQDAKMMFQSILGRDIGANVNNMVLDWAARGRGTIEQFTEWTRTLILNPAFRPTSTTEAGTHELRAILGTITDMVGTTQMDSVHIRELLRVIGHQENLTSRNMNIFGRGGLDITAIAQEFHMNVEDFRKSVNAGSISTISLARAVEHLDIASHRGTHATGEFAEMLGSFSFAGLTQQIGNLGTQIFRRWMESIDIFNDATYQGSTGLNTLFHAMQEINRVFLHNTDVIKLIGDIFNGVINGIFGSLESLDIQGTIIASLTWIRDEGLPTFIRLKNDALQFFGGIGDAIVLLLGDLDHLDENKIRDFGAAVGTMVAMFGEFTIFLLNLARPFLQTLSGLYSVSAHIGATASIRAENQAKKDAIDALLDQTTLLRSTINRFTENGSHGAAAGAHTENGSHGAAAGAHTAADNQPATRESRSGGGGGTFISNQHFAADVHLNFSLAHEIHTQQQAEAIKQASQEALFNVFERFRLLGSV